MLNENNTDELSQENDFNFGEETFNIVQNYIKKRLDKKNTKKSEINQKLSIKELTIEKFTFHGLNLSVNIINSDITVILFFTYDYSIDLSISESSRNLIFRQEFKNYNSKEITKFLFDFRKKYKYSKILDMIEKKELIEIKEKENIVTTRFFEEKEIDECCVCYEKNNVLTSCEHNLCRTCFEKLTCNIDYDDMIKLKECPYCRKDIFIECF